MRFLGLALGALTCRGLLSVLDAPVPDQTPPVCKDEWASPSVGRQGACSHHGGVQWTTPHDAAVIHNEWMAFWSVLAGLAVWGFVENKIEKRFPQARDDREVIEEAIKHQRDLRFQYKKASATDFETRHIKPAKIVSMGGVNVSPQLCVQGYCYARKEKRTFAIARMKDVEMV
jgi:hypothetical protein